MSIVIQDTIDGVLQVAALVESINLNELTNEELVKLLPKLLVAKLPIKVSGVVIGTETPSEGDRDKLWLRRDVRGEFVGLYAFQGANWHPFYDVADGETRWFVGNSNFPPPGWTFIDVNDGVVPTYIATGLRGQYIPLSSGPGFGYYAARFSGFDE